jgi:hypothetical protein
MKRFDNPQTLEFELIIQTEKSIILKKRLDFARNTGLSQN